MNMPRLIVAAIVATALAAPLAVADEHGSKWNVDEQGVVLGGYDVVSYFTADTAVHGSAKHSTEYDGVTFHFSSAENLTAFRSDPAKYAPRFGGYCAFGLAAHNAKVPANPSTFKIYNGELLLFFNDLYEGKKVNTKIMWNANEKALHATADKNWKTASSK